MYEEFNQYFAVSDGATGMKMAAFNTKLNRAMSVEKQTNKNNLSN